MLVPYLLKKNYALIMSCLSTEKAASGNICQCCSLEIHKFLFLPTNPDNMFFGLDVQEILASESM